MKEKILIRIDKELKEKIKEKSKEDFRSINNEINLILYNYFDLLEELKYNQLINYEKELENRVDIDYIIDRLEN